MTRPRRCTRTLALLAAGLLVMSACGDDSSSGSSATDPASGESTTTGVDSGSSGSGGGTDLPDLVDANLTTGTAHVEMSGDKDGTFDIAGTGFVQSGTAILSFGDGTGTLLLAITLGNTEGDDGIAFTGSGVSTAASVGDGCTVDVSKSDASALEGSFSCQDLDAVDSSTPTAYKIDVEGTFSLAA